MNSAINVLLVGDPHLGAAAQNIVQKYFSRMSAVIWRRGDRAGKNTVRRVLENDTWDLLISFYNDFVFSESELDKAHVALNVHPALPAIRGVGYDTLPLIQGHAAFGATLHFMSPEIDAGDIIRVVTSKLEKSMTHSSLRPATQACCRELLTWLCQYLASCRTASEIAKSLGDQARASPEEWGPVYYSRAHHHALLSRLRRETPYHRALR